MADYDEQLIAGEENEELEIISKVFAECEVVLGHFPQVLQKQRRGGKQSNNESEREHQLNILRSWRKLDTTIPINRHAYISSELPTLLVK